MLKYQVFISNFININIYKTYHQFLRVKGDSETEKLETTVL